MKRSSKRGAGKKKEVAFLFNDAQFSFDNNDIYSGGYKINRKKILLVKQGKGVYTTDNFDVYDAEWNDDAFADRDIHIRYNNDAQYQGRVDSNGTMNGPGTYMFPDGSCIEAVWFDNKPTTNITFREPLGYTWIVENESEDKISFSRGNQFWDELSDQNDTESTESLDQTEPMPTVKSRTITKYSRFLFST